MDAVLEVLGPAFRYLLGIVLGLLLARSWWRILRRTERAEGTVIHVQGSTSRRSRMKFTVAKTATSCTVTVDYPARGATVRFDEEFGRGLAKYVEGQAVPVLFDPANPSNAALDGGPSKYTQVVVGTVLYAALLGAALLDL